MLPDSQVTAPSYARVEAACLHTLHTATFSYKAFQQFQQSGYAGRGALAGTIWSQGCE